MDYCPMCRFGSVSSPATGRVRASWGRQFLRPVRQLFSERTQRFDVSGCVEASGWQCSPPTTAGVLVHALQTLPAGLLTRR